MLKIVINGFGKFEQVIGNKLGSETTFGYVAKRL